MYLVESTYQIITKYKTDTPISIYFYYLVNSPYIVHKAHNENRALSSYTNYQLRHIFAHKSSCAWAIDIFFYFLIFT